MNKQLQVPFEANIQSSDNLTSVAHRLHKAEKHSLAFAPWTDYPYKPEVSFSLSYNATTLFLQYNVKEADLQAAQGKTNGPVYQDSCVEFFVSFDDGASYYNFEFNCIGTVLAGYGKSRTERSWLPENVLEKISCQTVIQKGGGEHNSIWELTIVLPLEVFVFHPSLLLKGKKCRANFYKCGDNLPEPHYLAWSNIESEHPDFHLPRYFGSVLFE